MKLVANVSMLDSESLATVIEPFEAMAFWTAIALPFLHVPLLFTGLETTDQVLAFMGLLLLNVIALVLGHGYRRQ